jgi:hypothetical protein
MFVPSRAGGTIVGWTGADSVAGCMAVAGAIPESCWRRTKLRWRITDGALVMFGHRLDGRRLTKRDRVELRLVPGTYRIDYCANFDAVVRVGRRNENTRISAIRLTLASRNR